MTEEFLARAMDLYGDSVYRLALCRLQSVCDAEDVYQDCFLRFYQQSGADSWESERIKAWLLRVAINRCRDYGRSRANHKLISLDDAPVPCVDNVEAAVTAWDAVSHLPEKQRIIFHLYYSEGYKAKEIKELMGISTYSVRTNLDKARNALRKELY